LAEAGLLFAADFAGDSEADVLAVEFEELSEVLGVGAAPLVLASVVVVSGVLSVLATARA
jgi:hypothetical protein